MSLLLKKGFWDLWKALESLSTLQHMEKFRKYIFASLEIFFANIFVSSPSFVRKVSKEKDESLKSLAKESQEDNLNQAIKTLQNGRANDVRILQISSPWENITQEKEPPTWRWSETKRAGTESLRLSTDNSSVELKLYLIPDRAMSPGEATLAGEVVAEDWGV